MASLQYLFGTLKADRIILAYKKNSTYSNHSRGYVRAVAELVDDDFIALDSSNFCDTGKVFIHSAYDEIESKFEANELFLIAVVESRFPKENDGFEKTNDCKYVAHGNNNHRVKYKDCVQIIKTDLPMPNDRLIYNRDVIYTKYILVNDSDGNVYGPFEWSQDVSDDSYSINIELVKSVIVGSNLPLGYIFKSNINKISDICCFTQDFIFCYDLLQLQNKKSEWFDYASDDEIVKYCSNLAGDVGLPSKKTELASLVAKVKGLPKYNSDIITRKRLEKLPLIINGMELRNNTILEGLKKFLRSNEGEEIINLFVERNEAKYLEKLKSSRISDIESSVLTKKDELESLLDKIKSSNDDLKRVSLDVEMKKAQLQKDMTPDFSQVYQKTDSLLQGKQKELEVIDEKITVLSEKHKTLEAFDNIAQKTSDKEAECRVLTRQAAELQGKITSLKKELNNTDDELQTKLIGMKPYVDAINGGFVLSSIKLPDISVSSTLIIVKDDLLISIQKQVIDTIQSKMYEKGRFIDTISIANLMLSTQQSFICFLAGLPGVGKTSLSRLFAESQGLSTRLKEVSVARGWTSQKDLIGFYNPLSNRFQSANTDLYPFLLALEQDKSKEQSMAYILLDEANLSPIEHYWSIFMGKTDSIDREQNITLGGDKVIRIPKNLRFIATINYDSTTEPLSSRIVDRAPIIVLEGQLITKDDVANLDGSLLDLPISAITLEKLFGCDANASFSPKEQDTLKSIKSVLEDTNPEKGKPLHISPRKMLAIQQYCHKARSIMSVLSGENDDLIALDFAVLQHILPQVRGNGKKFAKRLEDLRKTLDRSELRKSAFYLERMINFGSSELDTYDYFCW